MMQRKCILTSAIVFSLLLLSVPVGAHGTLQVGPARITAEQPIPPGLSVELPTHTVTSGFGRDIEVTVSVADVQDEERILPPQNWFEIEPREFRLAEDESAEVQVTLNLPVDARPGEYRIWFRFHGVPTDATGFAMGAAVQVPFIFDVKGLDRTITLSIDGEGTVSPAPGEHTYQQGTQLELVAEPAPGWQFSDWMGLPLETGAQATHTVAGDIDITAVFERQEYQLTVAEPEGEGTVSPEPGSYTHTYEHEVALTAKAPDLWKFVRWKGPVTEETSPDTTVTVLGDAEVRAIFAPLELQSLRVEPSLFQLGPEDSREVRVFAVYEDGTEVEVTEDVTWTSADETVAALSEEGTITAQSLGQTTLNTEYEGVTAQLEVQVVEVSDTEVSESATAVYPWVLLTVALAAGGLIIQRRRNSSGDSAG